MADTDGSMADANAEAQMAAQDEAAFSADAYTYHPEADAIANTKLAEALSKDERADHVRRVAKARADAPPSRRSWDSIRATYQARQDHKRNVRASSRQVQSQNEKRHPDTPYAKYNDLSPEQKYGKFVGGLVGWFQQFWHGI